MKSTIKKAIQATTATTGNNADLIKDTAFKFGQGRVSLETLAHTMATYVPNLATTGYRDLDVKYKMPMRIGFVLNYVENVNPEIKNVKLGDMVLSVETLLETPEKELSKEVLEVAKKWRKKVNTYVSDRAGDIKRILTTGTGNATRAKNLKFFEFMTKTLNDVAVKRCKNAINKTSDVDTTAHQDALTMANKAWFETYKRVAKMK